MERELVELFEVAKKAADAAIADGSTSRSPAASRCVDALKQLKSFPVSYDALVATQVGKRLRQLTKHPSGTIKSMALDVLEIWKKIIIDETTKNKKNGSSGDLTAKMEKADAVKVESSRSSVAVKNVAKSENVAVEKIHIRDEANASRSSSEYVKAKRISEEKPPSSAKKPSQSSNAPPKLTTMVKCNDSLRDKIRELLAEAFSKVASEVDQDMRDEVDACDPLRVAVVVESVMFEKMGRSNGTQKFKYRSIMFNIKDPNNPDLRRRVLLGQIQPERLISMTPEEMASDERRKENSQIKEKALFDCERGGPPKATTDQFKCGRCGQRKTTYYQLQTRSADEPMTTFVTCVNCNNHWKFC
ncbi:hypothetical protein SAY87_031792 [Trapa incisa]|uniref:Transcription elongation factor n=1 Tax=Trapa incisa TaxID=236973 RepID=A0AAN7QQ40_9MYRT|nr:hypothetical protein SAY87_031792 [Trapa incisa]